MLGPPSIQDRIMPEPNSGCWIWIGARHPDGYGNVLHKKYGTSQAHRLVYSYAGRVIPEGMQLDHKCRNRACVNPDHLEPVSQHENWFRGKGPARLNLDKTHCPKGHELARDPARPNRRKCVTCDQEHAAEQRRNGTYKAWREKNREHTAAYMREYYQRRRKQRTSEVAEVSGDSLGG